MTGSFRWEVMAGVARERVVAIVRTGEAAAARQRCETLFAAGARVLEVSLTTPGALDVVAELAAAAPDAVIGVGTVLDDTSARLAALAGAAFVVTPTLDPRVIATAHRYGLCAIPGVASPSEAVAALDAGADAVKLFPAVALGVAGLAAIREALPQVPFVPTGGVRIEDADEWLAAGAVALGMGGALSRLAADNATQAAEFLRRLRLQS